MGSVLAIITGILLALPFQFPKLSFLAWISLIPLLYGLEDKSKKNSFYLGWIMGFFFLTISSRWILYPIINFSGYSLFVCSIIFFIVFLLFSLYFGLFTLILKILEEKFNCYFLLLVPITWTGIEYFRTIFSFQYLFNFLAYSQSFIPQLIQLAQYGGLYLISFIIVLINTVIYQGLKKGKMKHLITAFIIIVILFGYGQYKINQQKLKNKSISVGIIQPNISQHEKLNAKYRQKNIDKIINLSNQLLTDQQPDLLIWPETAILRSYNQNYKFPYQLTDKTPLFIGGYINQNDKIFNSALLVTRQRDIINNYKKIKLLPFGEYVPFPNLIPDIIKNNLSDLTPGNKIKSFELNNLSWNSPICSEILNPFFVRRLYQQTDFMINISNEAWFKRSKAPLQILQAVIFRAVEHQVPIVKVGNTGISGIVNYNGKVITRTKIFQPTALTVKLNIPTRKETLYYQVGDFFGISNLLIIVILLFFSLYKFNFK